MSRARVLAHYLRARRRRFADREAVERWQRRRLRRVLRLAPSRYAFYREWGGRPLTELPVVDKAEVLAHFAELNRRGLDLDTCLAAARAAERGRDFGTELAGLSVGLSSGTSGRQTAFLTSAAERDRWAGEVLARALPDGLLAGARITLVLRAGGPLYAAVTGGRISFRFVDLALPLDRLLAEIRAGDPTVLVAPPSILVHAAALGLRPRQVFSVAEVLDPEDERTISDGFGVRVGQIYQAAEGFLGISCQHGTLHLNEDLLRFEREELGDGRWVPVVTDLVRDSQAVIRRRLGDVLVDGPACTCGNPMRTVSAIVGRADDVLWLPAREGAGSRSFHPDFVRAAVLRTAGVLDFRLVQTAPDTVRLAVVPAARFAAAARELTADLDAAGIGAVRIEVGELTAQDPLVKRRRVTRAPGVPAGEASAR